MVKTVHRRAMEHIVIPFLESRTWGDVLDIGSKDARYKQYTGHKTFTTLDIEPKFHPDIVGNIEFFTSPIKYDTITCFQVLEHVKNPEAAIKSMYDLLKPNGRLILTTPFIFQVHGTEDFWRWTEHGLRMMLKRYFREINIQGYSNFIGSSFDVFHFYNRIPLVNPIVDFVSRIFGSHHCPAGYLTEAIK